MVSSIDLAPPASVGAGATAGSARLLLALEDYYLAAVFRYALFSDSELNCLGGGNACYA